MPLVQRWSVDLGDDDVSALVPFGDQQVFLSTTAGLMEIRDITTGAVLAQGLAPFNERMGSQTSAVLDAAWLGEGSAVVATTSTGEVLLSVISYDVTNARLTVHESQRVWTTNMHGTSNVSPIVDIVGPMLAGDNTGRGALYVPYRRIFNRTGEELFPGAVTIIWFRLSENKQQVVVEAEGEGEAYDTGMPGELNNYTVASGNFRYVKDDTYRTFRHVFTKGDELPTSTDHFIDTDMAYNLRRTQVSDATGLVAEVLPIINMLPEQDDEVAT